MIKRTSANRSYFSQSSGGPSVQCPIRKQSARRSSFYMKLFDAGTTNHILVFLIELSECASNCLHKKLMLDYAVFFTLSLCLFRCFLQLTECKYIGGACNFSLAEHNCHLFLFDLSFRSIHFESHTTMC